MVTVFLAGEIRSVGLVLPRGFLGAVVPHRGAALGTQDFYGSIEVLRRGRTVDLRRDRNRPLLRLEPLEEVRGELGDDVPGFGRRQVFNRSFERNAGADGVAFDIVHQRYPPPE